ncbi:MAG: zinc ABC transporter substrate-binding protein [Pseudomonadota bacterium]
MIYNKSLFSFILAGVLLMSLPLQAKEQSEKIHVFVTIPPHAYFAQRIAGPNAAVDVLVSQGSSPHSYEPSPKQIAGLAAADIYFCAGIDFEKGLVPKLHSINKKLKIVDIRGGHADPHIWLSPGLAEMQARMMADALCDIDKKRCSEYKNNLHSFLTDLAEVDNKIAKILAPFKGKSFYVFHPAFGYFADAYGLKQVAVEVEGKAPRAQKLANIIDDAGRDGTKVIFVEPQSSAKSARVIADAIGATLVQIDPLARDYLKNLETIAETIKIGLKEKP